VVCHLALFRDATGAHVGVPTLKFGA